MSLPVHMARAAIKRAAIVRFMQDYKTGCKSQDVADGLNIFLSSAQHYLREMQLAGNAVYVGSPGMGRWCLTEYKKETRQWVSGERIRLRKVRTKAKNDRRHTEDVASSVDDWCDTPPTKRLVRADQAKPLRVSGPNSVWALAA